jgi:putative ABC transport system ATP-binding protein
MSLALHDVTFAFPDAPPILDRASLEVPAGAFLLIRGRSGAGKSTLLRLLCRLEEPQAGVIRFGGNDLAALPPTELRRRVALLQQTPTLVDGSVRANLLLGFSFRANAGRARPDDGRLRAELDRLLLAEVDLGQAARTLSVGQAQRLCLLRSLLLEPEVLLLDEPTSALDADSARVVLDAARDQHRAGKTLLVIWHADAAPAGVTGAVRLAGGKLERA